jgi:ATP-dependent HslUV protease ATP-binding subunit HslU
MATEDLTLDFTEGAVKEIAKIAAEVNDKVENIGARRLQTVMEKLLEDISFDASERSGEKVSIDETHVRKQVGVLAESADLSRFIL